MISRRVKELALSNVDITVNNLVISNTNLSFRTNSCFGKRLVELIAEMVTDPDRPRVYLKTIQQEW